MQRNRCYDANNSLLCCKAYIATLQIQDSHFHGSVQINPIMMAKDAGIVMEEVVKHLTALVGAKVNVTLEIEADIHDGVAEGTVRTILENCAALKFKNPAFEEE